ncbi:hypothetical protein [Cytobacillus sp. NCCP-133]|uniref:hypothetical protein n=1 Tax=Cytobacillus sp. NCCP-133 TaxID=766848 RepID=UPI002230F9B8|nr:hypothetical protein [Cytobacillus sp. NCCP-133]GLB59191.1 hypothetical protein NCCP133_13240 [Cytobacillus sp. NCCP-133]
MRKLHKETVKRVITERGEWSGFLASSQESKGHLKDLWCFGIKCTIRSLEELEQTMERLSNYNGNGELEHLMSFYEGSNGESN